MIATYISFPLFGLNGLCIPQINSNFFEPSVGFKPTVRISILITSQAESFTVPRRRNAPTQFNFPYSRRVAVKPFKYGI